jgi:hypothetical protein
MMAMSSPTRVTDDASGKFEQFAANENEWRSLNNRYTDELIDRACAKVVIPGRTLHGAAAAEYLTVLIAAVATIAIDGVHAYSPVRWLWYLRRLPNRIFEGHYGTTLGYDRILAEGLSWQSRGTDPLPSGTFLAFRADESAFRHSCRLVAAAKLLSDLHAQYRRVGKGATLNLDQKVPGCVPDAEIDEFIRCYDERVDEGGTDYAGQGLSSRYSELAALSPNADLVSAMRHFRRCMPVWMPAPSVNAEGARIDAEVLMKYAIVGSGAKSFLDPYGQPARLKYLQEIEPLILLLVMFPLMVVRFAAAISSVMRFGYTSIHEKALSRAIDEWLPHVVPQLSSIRADISWSGSYAEWRERIDRIEPTIWPLEGGGVIRQVESAIMLDVAAASGALIARAKIDRQDTDTGNVRARVFELQVQAEIDDSDWAPANGLELLRGRTLRRNGQALTDIDALGAKSDTLLLISCKSLIYDREYDKGTHRVIRSAQDAVDLAVARWNQIISDLSMNPAGDNFDFRQFKKIIGVVCTPFIVYTSTRATLEFAVPGLRACSSESELRSWLSA